jgi:aryl-alcohol dehydrogenase-like predicted oxidoreductase
MHVSEVPLGPAGPPIPPLALGLFQWGNRFLWGYGTEFDADDAREALWSSLAAGVRLIDTAEVYGFGLSERLLADALQPVRVPVLVATKFFPFPWRFRAADLLAALQASLRRLQLDRVALYQLHWPTPLISVERLADWLALAVERGLAERVGVSNVSLAQLERFQAALAQRGVTLATCQNSYSLLDRRAEHSGVLAYCRDQGITFLAYSPLAQGVLTGKYSPERPPPGPRGLRWRRELARIQPLIAQLRAVGERNGLTPAQVALRWTIEKGTVPIAGAKYGTQARENAAVLHARLSPADVAQLDEAADQLRRQR